MRCFQMVILASLVSVCMGMAQTPLQQFEPDAHTLLLYHFDEGQGLVAKDSSQNSYDGEVHGAEWAPGKFGKALLFNGKDNSVYRKLTPAIKGLKQITVECWYNQENPAGRQFLAGKDATFHFDLGSGAHTSISLYNQGGSVTNADGQRHQNPGTSIGSPRVGRWHHNAVTYDGAFVSFFLDGVLKARISAVKDFSLGVESSGLWIGCYVGKEFWYSGMIDEFRVSDCVRYDPENKLKVGQASFDVTPKAPPRAVRTPQKTGAASVELILKKLYGPDASGWVCLKAPGKPAVTIGKYKVKTEDSAADTKLTFDVSDELSGDGNYILGLEPDDGSGYLAVTAASLISGGKPVAQWSGQIDSRRTFHPVVLVPLQVGSRPAVVQPDRIVLQPKDLDRKRGDIEVDDQNSDNTPYFSGEGYAEFWLNVPVDTTYRVHMRYTTMALHPCDFVIDGKDLDAYNMCARNTTERSRPRDALWEYQGTVTLTAGLHWLRVQDVLPDIVAIRLDPIPASVRPVIPWTRYTVPDAGFLAQAAKWEAQPLFGNPQKCSLKVMSAADTVALRFSSSFHNTDIGELLGGDAIRFVRRGEWDLEPFGQLTFRFEGQGSGHVVAIRVVDLKGEERMLWRQRDTTAGMQEVKVPVSFEGNHTFDAGHVVAICVDVDEGNIRPGQVNTYNGAIIAPEFTRRDVVVEPESYGTTLDKARTALPGMLKSVSVAKPLQSPGFRPWTQPVVPETHPLFATTEPKPVTRQTLGYDFHGTGARSIDPKTLDNFHTYNNFGDVCFPHIGICPLRAKYTDDAAYQKALKDFETALQVVKAQGLFMFDIWGYVPDHPDFPWVVGPEHREILLRVFGDRFLGFDDGEQDGRYIGSYAGRGKATNRREGWDDFVAWDKRVSKDNADYINATGSLNFSHYYGERGARLLGLETAQGLPSDTLMFSFLRGAGKQYGRLTYQVTSVWNRYGWNVYANRKTEGANGYGTGPNKGCSLSLHKRLFFAGYLGGHSICGTETSQFTADQLENGAPELSPLGKQHLDIMDWVRKQPARGVQYTPVAFMLDFYNGWNMPRHLYRGDKYKIWGKFPYEKGDYLVDGMLRMVWPGYEDCSYLRNERGFICPTPYGDNFDVIMNRCHPDVLKQYTTLMLLGDVEMTPDVVRNLTGFVEAGGDLFLDARQAKAFPKAFVGAEFGAEAKGVLSRLLVSGETKKGKWWRKVFTCADDGGETFIEQPYTYTVMTLADAVPLLVNESGQPLVVVRQSGKGRVIVGAVDYWMTDALKYQTPEIVNMEPPYLLLNGVRKLLDGYFASLNPVSVEPGGLTIQTCCYPNDPKHLLIGLSNNELFADWDGKVVVKVGKVATATELWLSTPVKIASGINLKIAAGDVAILDVRLK